MTELIDRIGDRLEGLPPLAKAALGLALVLAAIAV